jgi:O-antigen/teichoic acid export membrane protein
MNILKGAGHHRLLAFSSLSGAVANVVLSLLWIRPYGLVGQAMGTLMPLVAVTALVFWPAACRRVGVGIGHAFWRAVWPPLWPIAVLALVVLPIRNALPPTLLSVAVAGAAGMAGYAVTFLGLAVSRDERRIYITRAAELARWRRTVPAAA